MPKANKTPKTNKQPKQVTLAQLTPVASLVFYFRVNHNPVVMMFGNMKDAQKQFDAVAKWRAAGDSKQLIVNGPTASLMLEHPGDVVGVLLTSLKEANAQTVHAQQHMQKLMSEPLI